MSRELELAMSLRIPHVYCEDSWYSCPKNPDGCSDDRQGSDCNCGADDHNARVDELVALLGGAPVGPTTEDA